MADTKSVVSTDSKLLANYTGTTSFSTSAASAQAHSSKFWPNELDSVDSGTYNFKLYMTTIKASAGGDIFDPAKQKLIAQSGVTSDIEIKDVNIRSIIGISSEAHAGTSTTIDFTLTQPLGASLIDQLFYNAKSLGISNYTKIPYYLELSFKGRTADSSLDDTSISSRRWVWPILISKMDISVNSGGSEYRIKGVNYGDMANTNDYGSLKKDTAVTADTVFSFLTKLSASLTKKQTDEKANLQSILDEWAFVVDSNIASSSIVPTKPDENPSKQSPFSISSTTEGKSKGTVVQFNDGTDILRAIDAVLGNCEYFQSKVKGKSTPEGNVKESDGTEETNIKTLYRVYTDTIIKEFDEKRGDYARKFVYYIKEYEVGTLDATPQQTEDTATISNNKVKEFFKKNYLRKRYDYIFTGLNNQVLNFNLDFNFLWYACLAQQSGLETASNTTTNNAARTANTTDQQKKVDKKKNSGTKRISNTERRIRQRTRSRSDSPTQRTNLAAQTETKNNSAQHTAGTLPTSVGVAEESNDLMYGIEAPMGDGKTIMSTMFNQATTPDMMTLDLDIKGDPYWLEPAPYGRNQKKLENIISSTLNPRPGGMYEKGGQLFILFYANTPDANQLTSVDQVPFKPGQAISGIYTVLEVAHTFSKGQFTQKLKCVRERTIDVSLIPSLLREF